MIIPARWYNGGKGLDDFRKSMLNDEHISVLHDFPDTSDCFPGLNVRGGICYFLWEKKHKGECNITNHKGNEIGVTVKRPLLEKGLKIFVRYNEAISILKKVQLFNEDSFNAIVSSRKPFGLATNFAGFKKHKSKNNNILFYRFGENGFISKSLVTKNQNFIKKWKILVPYSSPGDDSYPHLILSKPIVAGPNSCCSETYLVVGPFTNEKKANNVATYMTSSFFRFMVLLAKSTQHITQKNYIFVPKQDYIHKWTDKILFKKYGISDDEAGFIETLIKPMNVNYE